MTKARLYFYATVCAVILIALVATFTQQPLFPFKTDDKEWLQKWLIFSVRSFDTAVFTSPICDPSVTINFLHTVLSALPLQSVLLILNTGLWLFLLFHVYLLHP